MDQRRGGLCVPGAASLTLRLPKAIVFILVRRRSASPDIRDWKSRSKRVPSLSQNTGNNSFGIAFIFFKDGRSWLLCHFHSEWFIGQDDLQLRNSLQKETALLSKELFCNPKLQEAEYKKYLRYQEEMGLSPSLFLSDPPDYLFCTPTPISEKVSHMERGIFVHLLTQCMPSALMLYIFINKQINR